MPDATTGLEKLQNDKTVFYTMDSFLRDEKQKNPMSVQDIKTFGASKNLYYNFMLTKNSPLLPLFKQASIQTFESGQSSRIELKWRGGEIKGEGAADTIILELGQVSLGFGFFVFSLVASLLFLGFEWCYKITIGDRFLM